MSNQIWKFPLSHADDPSIIKMPKNAQILSVQVQGDVPCIWAIVDTQAEEETRLFEIYGTGFVIPENPEYERKFIGTFQLYNGSLVFHLFERFNSLK